MTQYHVNAAGDTVDGFKCTACGHIWAPKDTKFDKCPACGYACNPYSCQIRPAPKKED